MSKVTIFSDGSSRGNPGPGGWGAVVATESEVVELGGREDRTTNNRMELTAALHALKHALSSNPEEVDVYTDSAYVIGGATAWGAGWRRNGWVTSTKQPVLNRDIWEELLNVLDSTGSKIRWHNVGGHVGIPGNERVDAIATEYADGHMVYLYTGPRSSYDVNISHVRADASLVKKKSDTRSRSNAKAYSYISEVDGDVQVHKTWAECEARVRGRHARFKKALTKEEESEIIATFSRR